MKAIEELAINMGIPFPNVIQLTIISLFFFSLYLLRERINPLFVFLFLFSPITINHLYNLSFLYFSYELFSFSLVLVLLERDKIKHSFLLSFLLSLLDTSFIVAPFLLFLYYYFKKKERMYLMMASFFMLFLLMDLPSFLTPFYYILPISFSLPLLFNINPLFFLISLAFSVFPSSLFPLMYISSKEFKEFNGFNKLFIPFLIFSIFSFSFSYFLSSIALLLGILNSYFKKDIILYSSITFLALLNIYLVGVG